MTRANLIKVATDAITGQGSDPQHLATLAVDAILAELPLTAQDKRIAELNRMEDAINTILDVWLETRNVEDTHFEQMHAEMRSIEADRQAPTRDSAPVVGETKPDINKDWKGNAQANAAALNTLYEYVGTNVGAIPAQEHMKHCAVDPVVLVKHIIETIQSRLVLNDGKTTKPNGFWKVTHNDDPPLPDDVEKYLRETMGDGAEEVWEWPKGDVE